MATQTETIKNTCYSQHKILYDIMTLHNNGEPFECDPTYSVGNFYGKFKYTDEKGDVSEFEIPQPKLKYDVYPQVDGVEKIEPLKPLPLADKSVSSIVIDLPFIITSQKEIENSTKDRSVIIGKRFSGFSHPKELFETYYFWIKEAYRVLKDDGICVWKTQRVVSGKKTLNSPEISWFFAESVGFDTHDQFYQLAKSRLISAKINKQMHSRSFISSFHVFKKSKKYKYRLFSKFGEELASEIIQGFLDNNLKNK